MNDRPTILIADDEVNLCRILNAEFSKAGYAVTAVHDGARAIECARDAEFSIIILDVRMPVLDGLAALNEIRKRNKETPIIVMTAYEGHDTMASALAMGATACVNKPFDLESLLALVKATLDEGSGQRSVDWTGSVRTVLFNRKQPVLLELLDGEFAGQYQSCIEEKDDQTLTVACPLVKDAHLIPPAGTAVSLGFAGEDAFYSFETTVLANRNNGSAKIVVGKPAVIYRMQRRKYPRLIANMPVELTMINRQGDVEETGPSFRMRTENVGPGGLKVISESRLPEGNEADVKIIGIPEIGGLVGRARIIRERKLPIDSSFIWEYGLQFTRMDEESRHALRGMVETGLPT